MIYRKFDIPIRRRVREFVYARSAVQLTLTCKHVILERFTTFAVSDHPGSSPSARPSYLRAVTPTTATTSASSRF